MYDFTVIGCGGTGGYVVPGIIRLFKERNIPLQLTLIDGDTVEMKNIPRQNFSLGDVGRFKAEVLAERYSEAYGVPIAATCSYAKDCRQIVGTPILCVDNNKIRRLVHTNQSMVIDVGNEMEYGQVFCKNDTFDVFSIHPEISKDIKKSCADTPEQTHLINQIASNATLMMINHLITTRYMPTIYEIQFDIFGNMKPFNNVYYPTHLALIDSLKYKDITFKIATPDNVKVGSRVYISPPVERSVKRYDTTVVEIMPDRIITADGRAFFSIDGIYYWVKDTFEAHEELRVKVMVDKKSSKEVVDGKAE